jgi:hypothetical protein
MVPKAANGANTEYQAAMPKNDLFGLGVEFMMPNDHAVSRRRPAKLAAKRNCQHRRRLAPVNG